MFWYIVDNDFLSCLTHESSCIIMKLTCIKLSYKAWLQMISSLEDQARQAIKQLLY